MRAVENFNMGHMCRPNAEREHRLSISQWTLLTEKFFRKVAVLSICHKGKNQFL